jgi:hypothetical protein
MTLEVAFGALQIFELEEARPAAEGALSEVTPD